VTHRDPVPAHGDPRPGTELVTQAEVDILDLLARTGMEAGYEFEFLCSMTRRRNAQRDSGAPLYLTRKQRQMIWVITWRRRVAIGNTDAVAAVVGVARSHDFSVGEAEQAFRSGRAPRRASPPADKLGPAIAALANGDGWLNRDINGWRGSDGVVVSNTTVNGLAARRWVDLKKPDGFQGGRRASRAEITAAGLAAARGHNDVNPTDPKG